MRRAESYLFGCMGVGCFNRFNKHSVKSGLYFVCCIVGVFGKRIFFAIDRILLLSVCFWCGALVLLCFYPKPYFVWQEKWLKILLGGWIFGVFWLAFNALYSQNQGAF